MHKRRGGINLRLGGFNLHNIIVLRRMGEGINLRLGGLNLHDIVVLIHGRR